MACLGIGNDDCPFPAPCLAGRGEGCDNMLKITLVAGLVFVALGVAFAFAPNIGTSTIQPLISIGTPLVTFSILALAWRTPSANESRKWLITFLAAAAIMAIGVVLASTVPGHMGASVVSDVLVSGGSAVMGASLVSWMIYKCCRG